MKQNLNPAIVGVIIAIVVVLVVVIGWRSTSAGRAAGPAPADMQQKMKEHMSGGPNTGSRQGPGGRMGSGGMGSGGMGSGGYNRPPGSGN